MCKILLQLLSSASWTPIELGLFIQIQNTVQIQYEDCQKCTDTTSELWVVLQRSGKVSILGLPNLVFLVSGALGLNRLSAIEANNT